MQQICWHFDWESQYLDMSITLDLTSTIRSLPMLPVDLIGACKGLYLLIKPSEAPRLAPVHLRHVANPHFYTHAQLPHHMSQRSSTTHNCRERKRRAALEAMVILMPSGCLSAAYFWFYVSKPSHEYSLVYLSHIDADPQSWAHC